jgi:hypothetical protein
MKSTSGNPLKKLTSSGYPLFGYLKSEEGEKKEANYL